MDQQPVQQPVNSMPSANTMADKRSAGKILIRLLVTILIVALVAGVAGLGYLYNEEKNKVAKHEQAAVGTRDLARLVQNEVYQQFTLVDERGHSNSNLTCNEIVASNNYEETKPEYRRLVDNGICSPFSDVYKPNYSAFTPYLQEQASAINAIYSELGLETISDFSDKPTSNYLFDTCWDIIEAGECEIDSTF
jgi:type II secretory pathway pseudopilin PulG